MKKLFSLFCVALASATLLAFPTTSKRQVVENPKAVEATAAQLQKEVNLAPAFSFDANSVVRKAVADVEVDTLFALYFVPGQFVCGTPSSGMRYVDYAQIIVPFADSVTFYNAYNVPSTPEWEVGDEVATGQTFAIEAGEVGGEFDLPTLKYNPQQVTTSDTTATFYKDYQFGRKFTSVYAEYGFVNNVVMAPSWTQSVTQCGYFTEYDEYGDGKACYANFLKLGDYAYGSFIINPYLNPDTVITPDAAGGEPDTTINYHYFDTIMSVINNSSTMYITQATICAADFDNKKFFPDDNTVLTMTILPISEAGVIDWAHPAAVGYAGRTTFTPYSASATQVGTLTFMFYKTDAAGMVRRVPAIVDGNFAVLISGLSQDGVTLGFYSDSEEDAPAANTYFTYFKDGSRKITRLYGFGGLNLCLNFFAKWPTIQGLPEVVNVPLSGGELKVTLPTNVEADYLDIFADDWMEIDVVSQTEKKTDPDTGEEYDEFLYKVDATITVEEADAAREGLIEIDALGKIYQVVVKQGSTTAVENVTKKINDNKLYNVLGIEVDENYKGVVIRNGEKFLQ